MMQAKQSDKYQSTACGTAWFDIEPQLNNLFLLISEQTSHEEQLNLLLHYMPVLVERAEELGAESRTDWLCLLRDIFGDEITLDSEDICLSLDLLMLWSDWPLGYYLSKNLIKKRGFSIDWQRLIYCCWMLGNTNDAIEHAEYLLQHQRDQEVQALLKHLTQWKTYCLDSWLQQEAITEEQSGLTLTPIGVHHCASFSWQYASSDIAKLCCLPNFENEEHWQNWMHEQDQYDDQIMLAIHHPSYGFIGSVIYVQHEDVGFIYYWLGKDFRHLGYARSAVDLVLKNAEKHWGMKFCYAKVFDYNRESRVLLARAGFNRVEGMANAHLNNEIFYHYGKKILNDEHKKNLLTLFSRMDSEITIMEV